MIRVTVEASLWDEEREMFVDIPKTELRLEHSLLAVSKWEAIWHVPFMSETSKTREQLDSYLQCMSLDDNVPTEVFRHISAEDMKRINAYIEDPQTASTVNTTSKKKNTGPKVITAEELYYCMDELNIPLEWETRPINRLIMLINVSNAKRNPTKMSKAETRNYYAELNRKRQEAKRKAKG